VSSSIQLALLYVPADRPDRTAKALTSGADAVILDLEDAVSPDHKQAARAHVSEILAGDSAPSPTIQVRINSASTPWHAADLDAIRALPSPVGVRVPKCETADEVSAVADGVGPRPLHVLIESALGVEHAFVLAAHPGVTTIGLGEADLKADLGVEADEGLDWARSRIINAAAAAGLAPPVMSVYTNIRDLDGLAESCTHGRGLGFLGRTAIHPSQLSTIRAAFTPGADQVASAQEIVSAWESAAASNSAAVALPDGRFVDAAIVRHAQHVLAAAHIPSHGEPA
jgi:citrate lyase subunit beta/citryl-CoA lyase